MPPSSHPPPGSRVLIVDDDRAIGRVLVRTLGPQHEARCFHRAEDALALLTLGERFDLILCDLMMPGMTGMDFHAAVVRLDPAQAARIVFLSGGACTPTATAFLASVPNRRLDKPFDFDVLLQVIGAPRPP